MSYFRVAVQREAERRGLTQADLARESGLSKSYISRVLGGDGADLSDENFVRILKVFTLDRRAQADIVAARCMDAKVGPGAELVEILIRGNGKTPPPAAEQPQVQLSQETEGAFAFLRNQCPVNGDLEKHLVGYARLLGYK